MSRPPLIACGYYRGTTGSAIIRTPFPFLPISPFVSNFHLFARRRHAPLARGHGASATPEVEGLKARRPGGSSREKMIEIAQSGSVPLEFRLGGDCIKIHPGTLRYCGVKFDRSSCLSRPGMNHRGAIILAMERVSFCLGRSSADVFPPPTPTEPEK